MVVKVINIKGKLTGHLSALSNLRYGRYLIQATALIEVIVLFLICLAAGGYKLVLIKINIKGKFKYQVNFTWHNACH